MRRARFYRFAPASGLTTVKAAFDKAF